jgi:hypothetical protein
MAGLNKAYKRRPSMVAMNGAPVMCLDAGSKLSYPGTGTTWTDLSGNGNNGTLTNGPTFDSANGGSLVFNGTNQYATTGNSLIPTSSNPYSVNCWVYRSTVPLSYCELLSNWGSSFSGNSFFLGFYGYSGIDNIRFTDSWSNSGVSVSTQINKWFYLSGVSTVTNAYIYVNGQLAGTKGSGLSHSSTLPVVIGRQGELSGEYFPGKITGISIYNRALSATEISTNFELLRGRYGI